MIEFFQLLFSFILGSSVSFGESDVVLKEEVVVLNNTKILEENISLESAKEKSKHIKTPEKVNSLYFNAPSILNETKLNNLYKLVEETEINSVTIDIKTVSGYTSFEIDDKYFGDIKPTSNGIIEDIDSIIKELHDRDIYVIARLAIFKDKLISEKRPDLALKWAGSNSVWSDYKGNKYLDPSAKEFRDYIVELSGTVYEMGFDEINFDYIRFPTDGKVHKIYYPFSNEAIKQDYKWGKIKVIDDFSNYATTKLRERYPEIVISADVFGLVTNSDAFQIGQNLESFLLNYDYVGPMIYPSHYGEGYLGFKVPDNNPYAIFKDSLTRSNKRIEDLNNSIESATSSGTLIAIKDHFIPKYNTGSLEQIDIKKIRPWIQGFSCTRCAGATSYNRSKFRKQIDAIEDSGLNSRWVWSSGSNYYRNRYGEKD